MLDAKLETLLTVYEKKSFSKAAATLSLTQPAVSAQISTLEKLLDCPLCIRAKGQLYFTPEGEIAVNYAKRMKAVYSKMFEEITQKQRIPSHIRLGITRAAESDSFVIDAIGKYISSNEACNITIISDTIKNLYMMLETHELDILIIDSRPNNPHFSYRNLDSTELLCIINKSNPLSAKSQVTLEELKKERWIMRPPTSATRALFEATLRSIHETIEHFNIVLEVDSYTTIKLLVKNNVGISIMPRKACQHDLNRYFIGLPIENLNMFREINLVYHKDFPYTNILDNLTRMYHEAVPN